jgi:two-component system sensor histidine kinase RegB
MEPVAAADPVAPADVSKVAGEPLPRNGDAGAAIPGTLRQLVRLRWVAIAGQSAAIVIAQAADILLPYAGLWLVVGMTIAFNAWSFAGVADRTPVTQRGVAAQLGFDLAAFSALIFLAGGTENPFLALYGLHTVLIALLLPKRLALVGAVLVVASFAISAVLESPLRYANGVPVPDAFVHTALGVSFALTTLVTAWYVVSIVAALRAHERLLRDAAARAVNDGALVRLGTLAAGAAHELGTPLTTIAVVAGEMARGAATPEAARDAAILAAQVDACRRALANITSAAGHLRAGGGGASTVDRFLESIVQAFRGVRPEVSLEARWEGVTPAPEIFADATLRQAILILLNNAADASPHHVDIVGRWDEQNVRLSVGDRGAGVSPARLAEFGRTFFTTKAPGKGTGLGLVLTASTVARLGGTVQWTNRSGGGLTAEVALPLASLLVRK